MFDDEQKNILIEYVLIYLISPIGQAEIFKNVKTTAQPSLSTQSIRDVIVAIPPFAEQQRIVFKVKRLLQMVNQLEQQGTTKPNTGTGTVAGSIKRSV